MSHSVWLPGPMFLRGGGLCAWSHLPSGGSVSRGVLVQKSGRYTYYWNVFLFKSSVRIFCPKHH